MSPTVTFNNYAKNAQLLRIWFSISKLCWSIFNHRLRLVFRKIIHGSVWESVTKSVMSLNTSLTQIKTALCIFLTYKIDKFIRVTCLLIRHHGFLMIWCLNIWMYTMFCQTDLTFLSKCLELSTFVGFSLFWLFNQHMMLLNLINW